LPTQQVLSALNEAGRILAGAFKSGAAAKLAGHLGAGRKRRCRNQCRDSRGERAPLFRRICNTKTHQKRGYVSWTNGNRSRLRVALVFAMGDVERNRQQTDGMYQSFNVQSCGLPMFTMIEGKAEQIDCTRRRVIHSGRAVSVFQT